MRVLHVLCDLNGGGAERLVLDLCRFAPPEERHEVALLHEGGEWTAGFEAANIPIYTVGRRRRSLGVGALLNLRDLMRGVDVVHTHLWAADTWGRTAAQMAKVPVVISTQHDTRPESRWKGALATRMAPLTTSIVCVSLATARVYQQQGIPFKQIEIIPNGVDLGRFPPRNSPVGPLKNLLAIGRLHPQKGFDTLIGVVGALPWLNLTLLGAGPDEEYLRRLATPFRDRIHFAGWQADTRPYLAAADLMVIPSRWEAFGLVAVEALASGVPVMASRVEGLTEVVGRAGLLLPPEEPRLWQEGLIMLRDQPTLRTTFSKEGPIRASRYHIRNTSAAYSALYQRLLHTPSTR